MGGDKVPAAQGTVHRFAKSTRRRYLWHRAISCDTPAAQSTQDKREVLVIGANTNSIDRLALTKEAQHSEPQRMRTAAFCNAQHVGLRSAQRQPTGWHWSVRAGAYDDDIAKQAHQVAQGFQYPSCAVWRVFRNWPCSWYIQGYKDDAVSPLQNRDHSGVA